MNLSQNRVEATLLKTRVYLAIPDKDECRLIANSLPDSYDATRYHSIENLLAAITADEQPELIVCHDDLIKAEFITAIATIKAASPTSKILVLGAGRAIDSQITVLKQGARGYFDNHLPADKLHVALQSILHGEVWIERHVVSSLIDELTDVPALSEEQQQSLDSLTPKEIEVATLVSHGATNKMIAHKMTITERTVKAHLTTIFHKMEISDRLSLAIFFRDLR